MSGSLCWLCASDDIGGWRGGLRKIRWPKLVAVAHDDGAIKPRFSSWRMFPGHSSCDKESHRLTADAGDGAIFLRRRTSPEKCRRQMRDVFAAASAREESSAAGT